MAEPGSSVAAKPWEEDFDFYFSETMKTRLVITLDLGAVELAPVQTHPLRLQARIEMRRPRKDGLRERAEADALFDLEDRLVDRMGEVIPLLYVGRLVAAGDVTLVWYAPRAAEKVMEQLTEVVRAERGDYAVHLSLAEDPDWGFYGDFMFPDVYNLQVMLNRRRLLTLAEHGDDGTTERDVEHLAYFPTRAQAEEAARKLGGAGFERTAEIAKAELPPDDELGWALCFQRPDQLADGRVDDVCIEILDVILPLEGYYDGWGVGLIAPTSTSP